MRVSEAPARRRFGFPALFAAAGAALAAALVLVRTGGHGVGLHWDSAVFVSVAENLLAGRGFVDWRGEPLTLVPPLYPLLLAAGGLAGFDPRQAAGPLNAAVLGLTVLAAGAWMRRRLRSRLLAAWGCLAAALSLPLAWAASQALTDAAFALFAVLSLVCADRFLDGGRRSSLALAAGFAALSCLTLYNGVAAVAAIALALLLQRGAAPWEKERRAAAFAIASLLPLGLWMAWSAPGLGPRLAARIRPVDYTLPEILGKIAEILGEWALVEDKLGVPVAAGVALLALLAAAGGAAARARLRPNGPADGRFPHVFAVFVPAFAALYVLAMMGGATWHGVQERHLAPLFLPLLFMAVFAADRTLARAQGSWPAAAAAAGLALWIACAAFANLRETARAHAEGTGYYNLPRWTGSETLRRLRENPVETDVYSNASALLFLHVGGSSAWLELPTSRPIGRILGGRDRVARDAPRLWFAHAGREGRVVWLDGMARGSLYDYGPADLAALPGVAVSGAFADGAVLSLRKAQPGPGGALGEPILRSVFDIYLDGDRVTWFKAPCAPEDVAQHFFLHLFPVDAADLSAEALAGEYDFRDFAFREHGDTLYEKCSMAAALPPYALRRIRVGQYGPDRSWAWVELYDFPM